MTLTETTAPSPTTSLSFELDLPHAPAKVWRALTDPALLAGWLLPAFGLELTPGAAFTLQTQAYPGWDGTVSCRFVEIEPGRRLSYTWGVPGMDTLVTFTLTPTAAGTHLTLVQSGFAPAHKRELGGARYGWSMMLGKLAAQLAGAA